MLTPLQELLLLAGCAGLVLGVLATLAGLHELSHRGQYEPPAPPEADDDTAEMEPIATRSPVRGRW
jgi:hypothetical protein